MHPNRLAQTGMLALLAAIAPATMAQVSLTTLDVAHTQNFDTLPTTGSATWTNNSTIPGWFHARTGSGTTIVANNGGSNGGALYSYGTGTATERALGSLGSSNAAVGNLFWGIRLQNNTGATITTLDVAYVGEQWRNSAATAHTVAFSYLIGAPTVTGTLAEFQSAGTAETNLDFTSPVTGGTAGALDGNLPANQVSRTFSITGLSIPNGTEIMLRWSDPDHTGADHGLSIDNFSVTPHAAAVVPNLSINDVSLSEGNAGTTTFTFTVSLDAPAGPGGVTFDIATADGTATTANNDYVATSLAAQTISAGNSNRTFNVTVNGDTLYEDNQTFFVNVANVLNATVTDGQGEGNIINDDSFPILTGPPTASVVEGDSGNTAVNITYSLSGASEGDATLTIDTIDGTATVGDGDYVPLSSATATIPGGSTSVVFTGAQVVGDTDLEADENFRVVVTDYSLDIVRRDGKGLTLPNTLVTIVDDDAAADLSISVSDSPDPVTAGQNITYVVSLTNAGPSNADDAAFTLPLPAGTTFVSLAQPGGWTCTTPAVGSNGSVSCTDPLRALRAADASKMGVGTAQFTIVANVDANTTPGSVLTSNATSSTATSDPNGANNATAAATTVVAALVPSVPVPTLDRLMLALLALAVLSMAAIAIRRGH